jgi:hypothetical protein
LTFVGSFFGAAGFSALAFVVFLPAAFFVAFVFPTVRR